MEDLHTSSFPIWDDSTDWWVLTAINSCGFTEKAIRVNPDSIAPPGAGFSDVYVSQRGITISVRDNAQVDGDRIDLFVNGVKLLNNYTLSGSPYGARVTLNSGQNIVTVTALNEGTSPPNTVEVSVTPISLGGFFGPETGKYSATDQHDFEFVSGHDCTGIFANPCNPWEIRVSAISRAEIPFRFQAG